MINPFDLMKKMGDLKGKLGDLNLEEMFETGEAGGGLVKVVVNGRMEIAGLELDPIAVDKRDIPMLQDLIIAAHKDASRKMFEVVKNKLSQELGIPGLASLNI